MIASVASNRLASILLSAVAVGTFAAMASANVSASPTELVVAVNGSGTSTLTTTTPDDPRSHDEAQGQGGPTYTWSIEDADGASPCSVSGSSDTATLTAGRTSTGTSNVKVKVVIHWPTNNGTGSVPDTTYYGDVDVLAVGVEIQVNDTPATNDDYVQYYDHLTETTFRTLCRVHLTGPEPAHYVTIILSSPRSKLQFTDQNALELRLPRDGSWAGFQISGVSPSQTLEDAELDAHLTTHSGDILGTAKATVFWFDQPALDITPEYAYDTLIIASGQRMLIPVRTKNGARHVAHAVDFQMSARLRPEGANSGAPQLKNIRIGFIQNLLGYESNRIYDTPTFHWAPGITAGTQTRQPPTGIKVYTIDSTVLDGDAASAPLYSKLAAALAPPYGYPNAGVATSYDFPDSVIPDSIILATAQEVNGTLVTIGSIEWTHRVKVRLSDDFLDWTVAFNTSTQKLSILCQRSWSVDVTTIDNPHRKATAGGNLQIIPTTAPVTQPPFPPSVRVLSWEGQGQLVTFTCPNTFPD